MSDFSFRDEVKKVSFWGDILAFALPLALASFALPHPWGALFMAMSGALSGTIKQALYDRNPSIPHITYNFKTRMILGALAVVGQSFLFWFTAQSYQRDHFLGYLLSYTAGSLFASFLNFVRKCMNDPLPLPSEQKPRPTPVIAPSPMLDSSGTLTAPRDKP